MSPKFGAVVDSKKRKQELLVQEGGFYTYSPMGPTSRNQQVNDRRQKMTGNANEKGGKLLVVLTVSEWHFCEGSGGVPVEQNAKENLGRAERARWMKDISG